MAGIVPIRFTREMPHEPEKPFWISVFFDDDERRWWLEIHIEQPSIHPQHVAIIGPCHPSKPVAYAPFGEHNGIGWAMKQMWDGARVRQKDWPSWQYLTLVRAVVGSVPAETTLPYVRMATRHGFTPWTPSHDDLSSLDWEVAG